MNQFEKLRRSAIFVAASDHEPSSPSPPPEERAGERRPFGIWLLEVFWDLEFGIWSFPQPVHGKLDAYAGKLLGTLLLPAMNVGLFLLGLVLPPLDPRLRAYDEETRDSTLRALR